MIWKNSHAVIQSLLDDGTTTSPSNQVRNTISVFNSSCSVTTLATPNVLIDFTSWVSLKISFISTFRASGRLINHPALPRTKVFSGTGDFQIALKTRTGLTKPGQIGSVALVFTWNGAYSLWPFSFGVLVYSPISFLGASPICSYPTLMLQLNSLSKILIGKPDSLFKNFPLLSTSTRGSTSLEHVHMTFYDLASAWIPVLTCSRSFKGHTFNKLSLTSHLIWMSTLCPIAPCTFFCHTFISFCSNDLSVSSISSWRAGGLPYLFFFNICWVLVSQYLFRIINVLYHRVKIQAQLLGRALVD